MKKTNSYLMFLLMLLFIGLPAMAQEAEEEAVEEAVAEEAVVEEEAAEEAVAEEAVVEEAVFEEEFVELEFEEESAGITIGVGGGFTVYTGAYMTGATSDPSIDIFVRIPYSLYLGPLNVSVGVELQTYSFAGGENPDISGLGIMGVANFDIAETPAGNVYAHIGAGYLGNSLGITAGAKFDYPIPDVMEGKLSATAFLKANATLDGGLEEKGDQTSTTGWANFGIALNYAL